MKFIEITLEIGDQMIVNADYIVCVYSDNGYASMQMADNTIIHALTKYENIKEQLYRG